MVSDELSVGVDCVIISCCNILGKEDFCLKVMRGYLFEEEVVW